MPIVGTSSFVVEQASGYRRPFPLEMLSVDQCWPDGIEDVRAIRRSLEQHVSGRGVPERIRVRVRTRGLRLSSGVWLTYGWSPR